MTTHADTCDAWADASRPCTCTPSTPVDPAFEEMVRVEVDKIRARDTAKRRIKELDREPTHREWIAADELLDEPDEEVDMRIDNLMPSGGFTLLAAQAKSGKTTLIINLIASLLSGDDFLGRFPVTPIERSIALVDLELPRKTVKKWLRAHGIRSNRVKVLALRGKVGNFSNLLDPAERARIATELRDRDIEVLIVDPLSVLLQAEGIEENSNSDVGRYLRLGLVTLVEEAGIKELIVAHHMGVAERSRGATVILDTPDAIWRLVKEENSDADEHNKRRYFSAYGRDVEVSEGELEYDADTKTLTLPVNALSRSLSRREARHEQTLEGQRSKVLHALYKHDGMFDGAKALLDESGLSWKVGKPILDALIIDKHITESDIVGRRNGAKRYTLTDTGNAVIGGLE